MTPGAEPERRIWAEPLTDNERHLMLIAFTREPQHAAKWGNHLLRCYDAYMEAAEVREQQLREFVRAADKRRDELEGQHPFDDWEEYDRARARVAQDEGKP